MPNKELRPLSRNKQIETFSSSFRLYEKDWERLRKVRNMLTEKTGRPQSITDTILYLLNSYESMLESGLEHYL